MTGSQTSPTALSPARSLPKRSERGLRPRNPGGRFRRGASPPCGCDAVRELTEKLKV